MDNLNSLIALSDFDLKTDLIHEYAAFRNLSPDEARRIIETRPLDLKPGSSTDRFYGESDDFLISLIRSQNAMPHLNARVQFVVKALSSRAGLDILDAGGGLGNYCIALARSGHRCTYADIPGVIADFARFRFNARGLAVECCDVRDLPKQKFQAVLSFDVLEHLDDPVGAMAGYAAHCAVTGVLFLTTDFLNFAEPFHLRKNMVYAFIYEELLAALGFKQVFDGSMGPLESVIKASIRGYVRSADYPDPAELLRTARTLAHKRVGEYHSYLSEEISRLSLSD